jgi:ubiquinone/menaquinone biosynthesis C-methylase UbiE
MKFRHGSSKDVSDRVNQFTIKNGSIVVDYGCGPGRYTQYLSEKVGDSGKVYAVDIEPDAIKDIQKLMLQKNISNIVPVLAKRYTCQIPSEIADVIFAIDMFHRIESPAQLLQEFNRIIKQDGLIFIDFGHQPKENAVEKIENADILNIDEITNDYVLCRKRTL